MARARPATLPARVGVVVGGWCGQKWQSLIRALRGGQVCSGAGGVDPAPAYTAYYTW